MNAETKRLIRNVDYWEAKLDADSKELEPFLKMAQEIPAQTPTYEQMIRLRYILESQNSHFRLLNQATQELFDHLRNRNFLRKKSKK